MTGRSGRRHPQDHPTGADRAEISPGSLRSEAPGFAFGCADSESRDWVRVGCDFAAASNNAAMPSPHRKSLTATFLALFLSGVAGVMNQVLWQRGLKIFLGGSETISAMIVVLVFMLGLGVGAALAGRWAKRSSHPLRTFASLELGLLVVNVLIAFLLAADLTESVYAMQRLALSAGLPLRVLYAIASLLVLLPPTMLMGATLPVATEACQRQFAVADRSQINVMFCVNTVGAVLGAGLSSFLLLPFFGQFNSLLVAAGCNLMAGVVLFLASRRVPPTEPAVTSEQGTAGEPRASFFAAEPTFGLALGFLSLGFEMVLFRVMMLAHKPVPSTFAVTLCGFLLGWSVGVYAAKWFSCRIGWVFGGTAVAVVGVYCLYLGDRYQLHLPMGVAVGIYSLPCVGFGVLYGLLVTRSARRWGEDVGRFYAMNTVGSCLGIVFFTLVGYELPQLSNFVMIAIGLLLLGVLLPREVGVELPRWFQFVRARSRTVTVAGLVTCCLLVGDGLRRPYTYWAPVLTYWGRDGVVEVNHWTGDLHIDGLWHSRMSNGRSHVGREYSWMMAVAGVVAHRDKPIKDALVIGNCIGMTATTLSKLEDAAIDAYEINTTMDLVLRTFPEQTLHARDNPRVNILWEDGRTGMALRDKQYDIIISAPLHLKQSGSATLLSSEYLQLVRSRLKPGGVFVLYSREGEPWQYTLIRRTVEREFAYSTSLIDGLLTVASAEPIDLSQAAFQEVATRPGKLFREIHRYDAELAAKSEPRLHQLVQRKQAKPPSGPVITDNHPVIEYPWAGRAVADSDESSH